MNGCLISFSMTEILTEILTLCYFPCLNNEQKIFDIDELEFNKRSFFTLSGFKGGQNGRLYIFFGNY